MEAQTSIYQLHSPVVPWLTGKHFGFCYSIVTALESHLCHRGLRRDRDLEQLTVPCEECGVLRRMNLAIFGLACVRRFLARGLVRADTRLLIFFRACIKEHELIGNVTVEWLAVVEQLNALT